MATYILVSMGSGNGLLAEGTKSLPEPMLIYNQALFCGTHMRAVLQGAFINSTPSKCLELTL